MQSGSLLPVVCATINKSGKIKEYVNIYEKTDIIKLRKYILGLVTYFQAIYEDPGCPRVELKREIDQECLWGIQTIKEFKVNRIDVFKEEHENPLKEFITAVDPIYKMYRERYEQ